MLKGEPSTEPSSKQIDVDSVTAEPISKVEPSPASEPAASTEPSPEIIASEETTAEPSSSSSSPDTSKKSSNKNGKVLTYSEELTSSIERKDDDMDSANKDSVESSTARKQMYTYDFVPSETPIVREEKTQDQQEHSSNTSEQTIMRPFQPTVEGSTLRSSTEQPAPVTEDLSDDTPMPTGSYFRAKSTEQRTEVNIMDGNVTPASVEQTPPTIYSTTAPIKLQYDDNSQPAIRVVPVASSSSDSPTYSVTENISEQSPFLPENENGDTILNILHTPHDDDSGEPKAKSLNIDEDDSLENDDANSISDHEITPKKTYKVVAAVPHFPDNSSTVLKEVDGKTEGIPSDSTEMYNLQESRTHNHDNTESTKMYEKHSSEETLEISHMQKGGAVPTTIIPVSSDQNDDSMEMEPMTDMTDIMSMISGKKLIAELAASSSSGSTEESTETLMVDQTTFQARNPVKSVDASSTEMSSTEHSKEEQIVPSSSEASGEQIPSAEPTPSPKVETASQSSGESELTTIRVEQTVSAVSVTNHTETKNEIITTTSGGLASEISPTAEPTLSLSNTDEKTPPLNDMESNTTKSNAAVKSDIAPTTTPTSENANMKSSTESMTETSTSIKLAESEPNSSAEPTPSESTETAQNPKVSEMDLKVIPLHTSRRPDRDDTAIKDDSQTENSSEGESTESTTGHFLFQATFQPSNKQSVGTSLNSSDKDGNDRTVSNDNGPENAFNDMNSTNVNFNDSSSSTSPVPMSNPDFVGYTRCTAGQFECLNGTSIIDGSACISLSQRCDAIAHCR